MGSRVGIRKTGSICCLGSESLGLSIWNIRVGGQLYDDTREIFYLMHENMDLWLAFRRLIPPDYILRTRGLNCWRDLQIRGFDWSAQRKSSLTVASAPTIQTPGTTVVILRSPTLHAQSRRSKVRPVGATWLLAIYG